MMKKHVVYKITSPSGKVYIGITGNIRNRFRIYQNKQKPLYKQHKLCKSILKYGFDSFKKEIIYEGLTIEEAYSREIEEIKKYKDQKISLNISDGGPIGKTYQIPVIQLTINNEYVKEWECAQYAEYALGILRGRIRAAISQRLYYSGGYLWIDKKNYIKGILPIRKHRPVIKRPIVCMDMCYNVVNEYKSVNDAAKKLNYSQGVLQSCLQREKKSAKGYLWCYKEEYINGNLPCNIILQSSELNKIPIMQYDKEGNFIAEYKCMADAVKSTGLNKTTIYRILNGKIKSRKNEWRYKYPDKRANRRA